MPVYEYRCTSCEHQFELWQEVGAEAPECPECSSAVKKIFHPVRTIYKGSGFYITDTRAEKSKSSSGSEAKSETKSESSSSESSNGETKSTTTENSGSPSSSTPAANTSSNGAAKTS